MKPIDIQAARTAAKRMLQFSDLLTLSPDMQEAIGYCGVVLLRLYPDGDFGPDGSELPADEHWVRENWAFELSSEFVGGAWYRCGYIWMCRDYHLLFGVGLEPTDRHMLKNPTRTQARALFTALGITERKP